MVRINKVATKTGDKGSTKLAGGSTVLKCNQRVNAYGTVDELGAIFGLLRCEELPEKLRLAICQIQNELFDVGSDVATPILDNETRPRFPAAPVDRLEEELEQANEQQEALTSFILSGGTRAAALMHMARTVTRRAERELVAVQQTNVINENCLKYLNRLSDWCFVQARQLNNAGKDDILWEPGK